MVSEVVCKDVLQWAESYQGPKFHAVLCDPPYGLEFMGKEWDKLDWKVGGGFASGGSERFSESPPLPSFSSSTMENRICRNCKGTERGNDRKGFHRCRCNSPDFPERAFTAALAGAAMQRWHFAWATAIMPHLHPGAFVFAFGGTRTVHRLTCALEDAGFEIRDSIAWMHGQGFPKSLNVGKAIDAAAGAERPVVEQRRVKSGGTEYLNRSNNETHDYRPGAYQKGENVLDVTAPATPEAAAWEGHGTALKPAHEVVVVARKPLGGTVAANCLKTGAGALNIDAGRIGLNGDYKCGANGRPSQTGLGDNYDPEKANIHSPIGRWPANVVLCHSPGCVQIGSKTVQGNGHHPAARGKGSDVCGPSGHGGQDGLEERFADDETVAEWRCAPGCPVAELDRQSGVKSSGLMKPGQKRNASKGGGGYHGGFPDDASPNGSYGDTGTASRFFFQADWLLEIQEQIDGAAPFMYCAKAGKAERSQGLAQYLPRTRNARKRRHQDAAGTFAARARCKHPTMKPLSLCKWLASLLLPPAAYAPRRILVTFSGAASEMIGCLLAGWDEVVGIERERPYAEYGKARLAYWSGRSSAKKPAQQKKSGNRDIADSASQQMWLF